MTPEGNPTHHSHHLPISLSVPSLKPPVTSFLFIGSRILNISYKWNLIIHSPLWLASFTWHNVFKVHPCCTMYQYSIPFYGWIIFHCMDIPHFVIHSSVDRYLGCFHFLAIMNNGALNICVQVLMWHMFSFLFGIHLEVELLSHMVILCLIFWRNCQTVFQTGQHFTFPTAMYEGSISPHLYQFLFLAVFLII